MKKRKAIDLTIILLWPIIAAIISFLIEFNALGSIVVFLAIPSIYLAFREKKQVNKALLFTTATSIVTMIWIDYVAQINGSWIMYPFSILPFKLFGLVTLEVVLWAFFTCFFIVIFYEYFLNKNKTKQVWTLRMNFLLSICLAMFVAFLVLLFNFPAYLDIPYFYLVWGTVLLLIPFSLYVFKRPKAVSKFLLAGAFFFYMNFIYEVVALKLDWWVFPGTEFIGWISIFGISFPLEEFLFWFILLALTTISVYEYFGERK